MTTTPAPNLDPLIELQLKVARRADELAGFLRTRGLLNLPCWFQAEDEIFSALRNPQPANSPGQGAGLTPNPARAA